MGKIVLIVHIHYIAVTYKNLIYYLIYWLLYSYPGQGYRFMLPTFPGTTTNKTSNYFIVIMIARGMWIVIYDFDVSERLKEEILRH